MARWTVSFQDSPEMIKIRADKARRAAHIVYVRSFPDLDIGGPLALCPKQDFPGAIWTVEAKTKQDVETLILGDPYYISSLRRYVITAPQQSADKQIVPQE